MVEKNKVVYEAPKADVMELRQEGIVCDSTNYVMWFLDGSGGSKILEERESIGTWGDGEWY